VTSPRLSTTDGDLKRFAPSKVQSWIGKRGIGVRFIEPGSPWQNGHNESVNPTACSGSLGLPRCFDCLPSAALGRIGDLICLPTDPSKDRVVVGGVPDGIIDVDSQMRTVLRPHRLARSLHLRRGHTLVEV
jgi:hypothetical protein